MCIYRFSYTVVYGKKKTGDALWQPDIAVGDNRKVVLPFRLDYNKNR
jgi:hypothetical protein